MESSFTVAMIEKRVNPDQSIDLMFESRRNTFGFAFLVFIALFPSLYAGWGIQYAITHADNLFATLVLDAICYGACILFLRKYFAASKKTITIIPGQVIKFDGKTLPFRDLESIGERLNPLQKIRRTPGFWWLEAMAPPFN